VNKAVPQHTKMNWELAKKFKGCRGPCILRIHLCPKRACLSPDTIY